MLTKRQFDILNVSADDWEIFYFPFAEVNYGVLDSSREVAHRVQVPAEEIAADLAVLVAQGFLQFARWDFDKSERQMLEVVGPEDLSMYDGYRCLTFDDHIATYGYGPHEFYITRSGVKEMQSPEYAIWRDCR